MAKTKVKEMAGQVVKDTSFDNVVSCDSGNGKTTMVALVKGKIKTYTVPHVMARVSGNRIKGADMPGIVHDFVDFMGSRTGYGDAIMESGNFTLSTHQNTPNRYGEHGHIFWALLCLGKLGFKDGSEIRMVVSVPPGVYQAKKDVVKNAFLHGENGDGWWTMHFSTNTEKTLQRRYKFKSVVVIPEGYGAFAGYLYDDMGKEVNLKRKDVFGRDVPVLGGAVIVGDGGMGTYDEYTIMNGSVTLDGISESTDRNGGIMDHVLSPLLKEVNGFIGNTSGLTPSHADLWLRQYMNGKHDSYGKFHAPESEGAGTILIGGYALSLKPVIESLRQNYAQWIVVNKIDPATHGVMNAYLPVGGAWSLTYEYIRAWRPDIYFIAPEKYAHTERRQFWDLNAIGAFAYVINKVSS